MIAAKSSWRPGVSQLRPLAAQPEAFFALEASASDGRGEDTLSISGANVASRPLSPPSGGRLDTGKLLNAITLLAGGAALAGAGFSVGYDCAEGAPTQTLSGSRGIRTEAVVMGVADVS